MSGEKKTFEMFGKSWPDNVIQAWDTCGEVLDTFDDELSGDTYCLITCDGELFAATNAKVSDDSTVVTYDKLISETENRQVLLFWHRLVTIPCKPIR